jgi:tetratricopeptide (TPR) repeat protein
MSGELLAQVARLLEVGRPKDAERLLGPHLAAHPTDAKALVSAARIRRELGDLDGTAYFLSSALSHDPDDFGALMGLFMLQRKRRQFADAEQTVLSLLCQQPESGSLYMLYAGLMMDTMLIEKARALLDEAMRLDPATKGAWTYDVLLLNIEGRKTVSRDRLTTLLAESPDSHTVLLMTMAALSRTARKREALRIAQALLRQNPADRVVLDMCIALGVETHPMMLPLWPLTRYGWPASVSIWVLTIVGLQLARQTLPFAATATLAVVAIFYLGYSWVAPLLVLRSVRRKGIDLQ